MREIKHLVYHMHNYIDIQHCIKLLGKPQYVNVKNSRYTWHLDKAEFTIRFNKKSYLKPVIIKVHPHGKTYWGTHILRKHVTAWAEAMNAGMLGYSEIDDYVNSNNKERKSALQALQRPN